MAAPTRFVVALVDDDLLVEVLPAWFDTADSAAYQAVVSDRWAAQCGLPGRHVVYQLTPYEAAG